MFFSAVLHEYFQQSVIHPQYEHIVFLLAHKRTSWIKEDKTRLIVETNRCDSW